MRIKYALKYELNIWHLYKSVGIYIIHIPPVQVVLYIIDKDQIN